MSDQVVEVQLPKLGMQTMEAEISDWFVAVGDVVEEGANLCEVATDKVEVEIPSPVGGRVTELRVEVGDSVEVGAVICVVSATQT